MTALGDFLERIHAPREPFTTVRATIRHWENTDLAGAASYSKSAMGRRKSKVSEDPASLIREKSISIWARMPDHFRVESSATRAGKTRQSWEVTDGVTKWALDRDGKVTIEEVDKNRRSTNEAVPVDIARHFSGGLLRAIVQELILEPLGRVQTAERDCLRLRATARHTRGLWPHWIPGGADTYELHADLQTGALLYIGASLAGQVFEVNEVLEVTFDEPLGDDLFRFTPSEGEELAPARPITERMTLAEAIERMPFTVLVPQRVPTAAQPLREVMHHPPRSAEGQQRLILMYEGLWIKESAAPDPELADLEWEEVEHEGRTVRISDPGKEDGYLMAAVERGDTHVTIFCQLDRQSLLDLAVSLAPAHGNAAPGT